MNDKRIFWILFGPLLAVVFMCLCAPVAFADGPETNSLPSASDILESAPDSSSGISTTGETSEARPLLSTPLDSYSVVEGLLFLIFLILLFLVLIRIFGF